MPPKTITTNKATVITNATSLDSIGLLTKYPSVSNISFTTSTTGTSSSNTEFHPYGFDLGEEVTLPVKFPEFHPEWNCKPERVGRYNPLLVFCQLDPAIVNINIIVPEKVVEVTIFDGEIHTYKQVCKYPDDFDLTFALALAWTKYKNEVFNLDYTLEGIEDVAHEYIWKYKKPLKEFNRAIKAYNKWFKEKTRKEAEEEERQTIIERRRAKNKKRKEKMRARKKQEEISTIAEAIKKARE